MHNLIQLTNLRLLQEMFHENHINKKNKSTEVKHLCCDLSAVKLNTAVFGLRLRLRLSSTAKLAFLQVSYQLKQVEIGLIMDILRKGNQ